MAAPEFNPDLAVVVRKPFPGPGGKAMAVGTVIDWKAEGWREDRVAAMVRTRLLEHTDQPVPKLARKQAKRLAAARKPEKTHAPAPTPAQRRKQGAGTATAKAASEPLELTAAERTQILKMRRKAAAS